MEPISIKKPPFSNDEYNQRPANKAKKRPYSEVVKTKKKERTIMRRTHTIKQLRELEKETEVVLVVRLVHAQTEFVGKMGKNVMNWTLMDGTGFVMCNIWDDNNRIEKAEKSCKVGDVIKLSGKTKKMTGDELPFSWVNHPVKINYVNVDTIKIVDEEIVLSVGEMFNYCKFHQVRKEHIGQSIDLIGILLSNENDEMVIFNDYEFEVRIVDCKRSLKSASIKEPLEKFKSILSFKGVKVEEIYQPTGGKLAMKVKCFKNTIIMDNTVNKEQTKLENWQQT